MYYTTMDYCKERREELIEILAERIFLELQRQAENNPDIVLHELNIRKALKNLAVTGGIGLATLGGGVEDFKDYSDKGTFTAAYSAAKKDGRDVFTWKNKRYNTKYAGTPRQEVGKYGAKGKRINPKDLEEPVRVNTYPAGGQYIPGHIAASIADEGDVASVNYYPTGNMYNYHGGTDKDAREKAYYVYGADKKKFYKKVEDMPTGEFEPTDKRRVDYNLLINNCADNVCDAFGIPRNKRSIDTPKNALAKIKKKYPTVNVTGRTLEDYDDMILDILEKTDADASDKDVKKVLKQAKNLIGLASSPDLIKTGRSELIISALQAALIRQGYPLTKSRTSAGDTDGVYGKETKEALKDYLKKNK